MGSSFREVERVILAGIGFFIRDKFSFNQGIKGDNYSMATPRFDGVELFLQIVESGNLTEAAERLNLPRSGGGKLLAPPRAPPGHVPVAAFHPPPAVD
jgi:hypothetical protein